MKIMGGTIHLINAGAYIKSPMIYGWEETADRKWQQNKPKDANGNPVYYTTADLTGIYENNTLVEKQVLKEAPTSLRMSGQIPTERSICTFRFRRQ